jgi:hypothetical protein
MLSGLFDAVFPRMTDLAWASLWDRIALASMPAVVFFVNVWVGGDAAFPVGFFLGVIIIACSATLTSRMKTWRCRLIVFGLLLGLSVLQWGLALMLWEVFDAVLRS